MKKAVKKSSSADKSGIANLSLEPEIKEEAQRLAKERGETLSGMVERLLLREIAEPTQISTRVQDARELRAAREALAAGGGATRSGATIQPPINYISQPSSQSSHKGTSASA